MTLQPTGLVGAYAAPVLVGPRALPGSMVGLMEDLLLIGSLDSTIGLNIKYLLVYNM